MMRIFEFSRRAFLSILPAAYLAALKRPAPAKPSSPDDIGFHENFIPPNVRTPTEEPFPGVFASRGSETVYLIRCGDRSVLVDTGYLHNTDAHLDNFESAGIDLGTIAVVFVSHFHVDHVAGLAHARQRLKCPVVAHKNAVPIIEKGDRVITAAHMPYLGWDFPFPPCEVDEVIEDGDTLEVGGTSFKVAHIPGHTPGCVGYFWEDKLISGDVLFPDGTLGWMDAHWGSNLHDTIDTMARIEELAPKHLLPTHGLPFEFDATISEMGRARAKHLLEDKRAGVLGQTHRAELRDPQKAPRTLQF